MSTKEDDDSNDSSGQGLKALGESDEKKVWCTEEDWLNYKNKKHFIRGDNSAWAKTLCLAVQPCLEIGLSLENRFWMRNLDRHLEGGHRDKIPRRTSVSGVQWKAGEKVLNVRGLGPSLAYSEFDVVDIEDDNGCSILPSKVLQMEGGVLKFAKDRLPGHSSSSLRVRLSWKRAVLEVDVKIEELPVEMPTTEDSILLARIEEAEEHGDIFVCNTLQESVILGRLSSPPEFTFFSATGQFI